MLSFFSQTEFPEFAGAVGADAVHGSHGVTATATDARVLPLRAESTAPRAATPSAAGPDPVAEAGRGQDRVPWRSFKKGRWIPRIGQKVEV